MDTAKLAILMTFLVPIIGSIGYFCYLSFVAWQETALKRDMVARGYTANEIIDVINGSRTNASSMNDVPPAKPIKQPA